MFCAFGAAAFFFGGAAFFFGATAFFFGEKNLRFARLANFVDSSFSYSRSAFARALAASFSFFLRCSKLLRRSSRTFAFSAFAILYSSSFADLATRFLGVPPIGNRHGFVRDTLSAFARFFKFGILAFALALAFSAFAIFFKMFASVYGSVSGSSLALLALT